MAKNTDPTGDHYRQIPHIIDSVDSICRDSADTQYMLTQTNFSKSPKQQTYMRSWVAVAKFDVYKPKRTRPRDKWGLVRDVSMWIDGRGSAQLD